MIYCIGLLLLPIVTWGFNLSFSVFREQNEIPFNLQDGQNPVKALRSFCDTHEIRSNPCTTMIPHIMGKLRDINTAEVDDMLCGYDDDVIVRNTGCVESSLVWGSIRLYVNLAQLGKIASTAELKLPPFVFNVDTHIHQFCFTHFLSGLHCRQLRFEVGNHLTSLYERPQGVTLANAFEDMYFKEDLANIETFFDFRPHGSDTTVRYFFAQGRSYFVEATGALCMQRGLTRVQCTQFVEFIGQEIAAYYGPDDGELWCVLYLMRAVNTIVENNRQRQLRQPAREEDSAHLEYVDADFIEIGTSNFNTLTQLVDISDGLIGFAVEPSAHYLRSLPDKPLITKANCAIVSVKDAPPNSTEQQYVQLYSIPEEVIDREGLPSFLKGCNAVGKYHMLQVMMGLQHHVQIDTVPGYTVAQFLALHRIRRIRLLKVDAEGYDVVIVEELYQHLLARNDPTLYPERIVFETNENSQAEVVEELIHKFKAIGYTLRMIGGDTILELRNL